MRVQERPWGPFTHHCLHVRMGVHARPRGRVVHEQPWGCLHKAARAGVWSKNHQAFTHYHDSPCGHVVHDLPTMTLLVGVCARPEARLDASVCAS